MLKFFCLILCGIFACGCATTPEYDPLASAANQTFSLNDAALKKVSVGMKQDEVHNILGQQIIIGYQYEKESASAAAKPLTLANPYKIEDVKTAQGKCTVEYYVTAVRQPDGVVSDDEMMGLLFCNGILTDKGWDKPK